MHSESERTTGLGRTTTVGQIRRPIDVAHGNTERVGERPRNTLVDAGGLLVLDANDGSRGDATELTQIALRQPVGGAKSLETLSCSNCCCGQ